MHLFTRHLWLTVLSLRILNGDPQTGSSFNFITVIDRNFVSVSNVLYVIRYRLRDWWHGSPTSLSTDIFKMAKVKPEVCMFQCPELCCRTLHSKYDNNNEACVYSSCIMFRLPVIKYCYFRFHNRHFENYSRKWCRRKMLLVSLYVAYEIKHIQNWNEVSICYRYEIKTTSGLRVAILDV